jgi:hypothetical protein
VRNKNEGIAKLKVGGLGKDNLVDVASSSGTNLSPVSAISTGTEDGPFDEGFDIATRLGFTQLPMENGSIDFNKSEIIASSNFSIIYRLEIAYRPEDWSSVVRRSLRNWHVRNLLLKKCKDNIGLILKIEKLRNRSTTRDRCREEASTFQNCT